MVVFSVCIGVSVSMGIIIYCWGRAEKKKKRKEKGKWHEVVLSRVVSAKNQVEFFCRSSGGLNLAEPTTTCYSEGAQPPVRQEEWSPI